MRPPADVLVVGDALLDVSVLPAVAPRPGSDVPATVRVAPGGQGANVAVRLARRGVPVRLVCALGNDAAGGLVGEALTADGVELDRSTTDATGSVIILIGPDGERTMLSHRVPLLPRAVEAAPWTIVSGYALLERGELEVRGDGRRALLGCALLDGAAQRWAERVRALNPDLVILNADEARPFGGTAPEVARALHATVVVTDVSGATAADAGGTLAETPEADRVPAIDTTGAGDAFAAGAIHALMTPAWPPSRGDLLEALDAGARLAGEVAAVLGAQGAVPSERARATA